MIRKLSTKQSPKPPKAVLDSEQLQTLVTDLTECNEGLIAGGQSSPIYYRSFYQPIILD